MPTFGYDCCYYYYYYIHISENSLCPSPSELLLLRFFFFFLLFFFHYKLGNMVAFVLCHRVHIHKQRIKYLGGTSLLFRWKIKYGKFIASLPLFHIPSACTDFSLYTSYSVLAVCIKRFSASIPRDVAFDFSSDNIFRSECIRPWRATAFKRRVLWQISNIGVVDCGCLDDNKTKTNARKVGQSLELSYRNV